jgi:hypothetical protein
MVRDISSMALLPLDNSEKNDYYRKLRVVNAQKDEINNIKTEMNGIKSDMVEIKDLMRQLLGKG